ncbi:MAG: inorganic pyrophosphatase [Patescibacteria group bacterium]|nr:MAG: inorganic pyrophosphatase [Patescibacteria group bacterium]
MNLAKIKTGENPPEQINVVIEIPQNSAVKYELDKDSSAVFVDRILYGAMVFPFNYGFIPHTNAEDGDPVDVLVLSSQSFVPSSVVPSRVIGMLEMEDEAGIDTKIIAVPEKKIDPFMADIEDVKDLSQAVKDKIKNFFDRYKDLEPNKWVKTKNFLPKQKALEAIQKAL